MAKLCAAMSLVTGASEYLSPGHVCACHVCVEFSMLSVSGP